MGYTHYWHQRCDIGKDAWGTIVEDVAVILAFIEHEQGVPLASWIGAGGSRPLLNAREIAFNGLGDDQHESLVIQPARTDSSSWFCKTARKPYDLAVTAVLSYLSSVAETHYVTSDGHGAEWLAGVEAVRQALPQYGNTVDIPRGVMENDRWVGPWIHNRSTRYQFRFCIDGKAYIIRAKDGLAYVFPNHKDAAAWALPHNDLLNPMGSFTKQRWTNIASGQTRLFKAKFEQGQMFQPERMGRPPLYVRPDEFPRLPHQPYYLADVLKLAA